MTPDEYEARLRDAVFYACIMPDGGGVAGREAALTAYADWLRLRAVAEYDPGCCPAAAGCWGDDSWCHVHAELAEARQKLDAILAAEGSTE